MDDGKGEATVQSLLNQPTLSSPCDLSFTFSAKITQSAGVISSEWLFCAQKLFFGTGFLGVCVYVKCIVFSLRPIFFSFFIYIIRNIYVYMCACILLVLTPTYLFHIYYMCA